jgi:quinoprotein glucose dehydrogenase
MRHSTLDQINKENVKDLEVAWVHDTGEFSDGNQLPTMSAFETTPLLVDGVLYVSTVFHRLIALDPTTGQTLWEFDPKFDRSQRVNLYHSRGVAFWTDGARKRVFLGDQLGRLFSIDPETRKLDPAFGVDGVVDLKVGMFTDEYPHLRYGLTSPVAPCGDVVVAGGWVSDGEPHGPSGDIRAFDARTGELVWRFHTVPRPGEYGYDTWNDGSWKERSGVNAWSTLSVDPELGWVFVPLTSPGTDTYGGDRGGMNLFSNAIVALDCKTGKRQWHFQTIHHDLWDWDLPVYPNLVDVVREDRKIPAVAQVTKTGFVFVLDRVTGRPLFPVEERPVEMSDIPGEESWPTQPFPVKPPPFARQSMTVDEITDITPESRADCMEIIEGSYLDGAMFRPARRQMTIIFPGSNGSANWGGASFDPTSSLLYVNSMDVGTPRRMVERPEGSLVPFRSRGTKYGRFWDSNQYPCQKPPWAHLTAIDLNTGEFRWRVVLGEFDELTKKGIPKTGAPNLGGSIVTAGGLVFIAATNDKRIRAFDKDTGRQLWEARLPESGMATPMTYLGDNGKQYVVIAAGGGNDYNDTVGGKVVAFSLP